MFSRTSKALTVAATLLCVGAAACTDPTVAPVSSVSSANIFNDPNSYKFLLAKIYGGLILTGQQGPAGNSDISGIDEGFSEYLRLYWYLQEMPTDEAVIGWNDPGLQPLNTGTWGASNEMVNAMYYRIYFQIQMANQFLRESTPDKLAGRGQTDPALLAAVHGYRFEARFLRALSYWHGLDMFGSIPIVTENDALGSVGPAQPAGGRTDVYNFVVNELKAIADSLPAAGASTYARATPGAAHMLLAELYLNAGVYTGTADWADASAEAAKVIGGGYTLASNFRDNFTADNNTSPEIIFVAAQDGSRSQTWGGMTFLIHAGCGGSMSAGTYGIDYCWGGYRMKPQIYATFDTTGADARTAFFWKSGQVDSVNNNTVGTFTYGIAAPKFTNKTSGGGNGSNPTMVDTDFPIFRLAEAYLIYAEAALHGAGSQATALTYMNALRSRAFGDNLHGWASFATITADTLLAERGRELMFEARRRTDLIRFGKFVSGYNWALKGGASNGQDLPAGRDLYPIPSNVLIANPALKQNPGY